MKNEFFKTNQKCPQSNWEITSTLIGFAFGKLV